jgi:hypothetical protein
LPGIAINSLIKFGIGKAIAMRPGATPYGYAYLEGKLVKDPKEYKTLLQIQKLWKSGKSCSDIAAVLNNQKTPTRRGKRWGKSVIGRIIKRQEEQ